ncbi:MAG: hypothetical protein FWD98_09285, partial [Defluviitaleaceae bacterium]|nr:hypothetical protein [Defluviitaleaceae bacterium]
VLYGKTVSSVYDKDPRRHDDARRFRTVSYDTVLHENLDVADIAALSITHGEGLASVVFGIAIEGSILTACEGTEGLQKIGGTYIANNAQDIYY